MAAVIDPKVFSLHGRGLRLDTKADIEPYLTGFDPALIEEIHLGGNTLGIEASEALAEFLGKTTALKVADFADIFTGRLISEIPQALQNLCDALIPRDTLIELNLSDNAFGGRSVEPIVPFLTKNRSFQILKLNNNGLGPAGGAVIADALLLSAQLSKKEGKKSSLRTVICGRNRLEDGAAGSWAAAFREHGGLVEIKMPQNGIRMDGIVELVRGISANPGLQHLDLQDNTFSEKGAKAMADALKSWPELLTLNVSDCHIAEEDGDVSPIFSPLAAGSNPKLNFLKLENNNLETRTFELLAEAIPEFLPVLKHLEIQWNDFEEEDEVIQSLVGLLQRRGGKVIVNDEEEEEEELEAEEAAEEEALEAAELEAEAEAAAQPGQVIVTPERRKSMEADKTIEEDLAELLSKVALH
ncbi:unnamed protein product [Somion occarium]|uniref:Ran GTPase activating protein 1 n=1 Tax=Somion occarium TaxID=3059160 RepID=A0ABP1DZK9_9APHY